ncbi:MAG: hypothetical protein ACOYOB_01440 [Myxococcota bacterium]
MTTLLDTVLLFSLPASGKSEVRRYLEYLTPTQCREEFHIGPTLQLDDYPYVHFMHRIDDELKQRGQDYVFYHGSSRPFREPFDWLTLTEMLNEDYADLVAGRTAHPASAAQLLFDRLDAARVRAGVAPALGNVPYRIRCEIAAAMEAECAEELAAKNRNVSQDRAGKTLFMEAARGGPNGAAFPLTPPRGYLNQFHQLRPEILDRAVILYIWVSPEESRRKNIARGRPDGQGSILHHSAPWEVMLADYGCDDMEWLMSQSDKPNTVKVERILQVEENGQKKYVLRKWYIPVARFDNRIDKTSFIRKDTAEWGKDEIQAIHGELARALGVLADTVDGLRAEKA